MTSLRPLLPTLTVVSLLAVGAACRREDPHIRELTRKAAMSDAAARELREAWEEQQRQFLRAGPGVIHPGSGVMVLTSEQREALEDRVRREKNLSRRALFQEILEKDQEIGVLNARLNALKADLPRPDAVEPNDSHYGLAMRFLRGQGVSDEQARRLVSRASILGKLVPGFEVYHFYANGSYGTWVAQGRAAVSPAELNRQEQVRLEGERNAAVAQSARFRHKLRDLEQRKQQLEEEVARIQAERTELLEGRARLEAASAKHAAQLNAVHYVVGSRDALEKTGIIDVPFFGKARAGRNWSSQAFTQHLDLRCAMTLTIRAADLGLKRIGKVIVVPGSYVKGQDYRLSMDAGRQTAVVELLAADRFKNDMVVFAVVP